MIPNSVVMAAGWLFIWALGIGLASGVLMIIWDKLANRIDRMWIKNESTDRLKRLVRNINEDLERRGSK